MLAFIDYLLKLSIGLAIVYIFYALVLRRLTFYSWNRWFLLGYSAIAYLIPFINISSLVEQSAWNNNGVIRMIPVMGNRPLTGLLTQTHAAAWTEWDYCLLLISTGGLIMLVRLLIQYFSLYRATRSSQLIFDDKVKVYQVDKAIIPFSFGNAIFINQHQHNGNDLKEIIRHEFVHVKQKHTVDILWTEVLCILNWYNPFAWLLRKSIRQNLEFIADHQVLVNGIDRKEYQYLLLKVMGAPQFSISNQFNFSSLKKRIAMMNKMRSARVHLLRFLFLLPVIAILLLAFRKEIRHGSTASATTKLPGTLQDTVPDGEDRIIRFPDEIESISLLDDRKPEPGSAAKKKLSSMVVVKRKDGKKEVYDRRSEESRDQFEKKYSVSLEDLLPPPAPPVPPAPPTPPSEPRIPKGISSIDVRDKKWVTIKTNNGTTEKYDMTNEEDNNKFKSKYGITLEELLPATPLPPPAPVNNAPAIPNTPNAGVTVVSSIQSVSITPGEPVITVATDEQARAVTQVSPAAVDVRDLSAKLDGVINVNGVVDISTKKPAVKDMDMFGKFDGVISVDGKEYDNTSVKKLNLKPEDIQSIAVWQLEEAVKKFGEKGKKGVIVIETKKSQ